MFTLAGSSVIALITLVASIGAFLLGVPELGFLALCFTFVFGIAAFVQWTDRTET